MGAGSAKGVQQEEQEDDVDSFSSASSEHWENEGALPAPAAPTNPKAKPLPPPPPPKHHEASTSSVAQIENGEAAEERKEKQKKKTAFGFSLRRDQQHTDKVDDVHNESSDEEASRERERKTEHKGDKGKDRKGFRLFGWRKDEKKHDKDEALDEDLDDLEKTFDSLGIVGKNMWGGTEKAAPKQDPAKEEVLLSPMRKRKNVRGRGGVKGVNGTAVKANGVGSSGSTTSKRTFKFSWETDKQKSPIKDEDDEWEYKAGYAAPQTDKQTNRQKKRLNEKTEKKKKKIRDK